MYKAMSNILSFVVTLTLLQEGFSQVIFKSVHHHYHQPSVSNKKGYDVSSYLPDSFDWRDKGIVSYPKNQGSCGAGWAFALIGAIEGQYAKQYGNLLEFSPQELLDCLPCYDPCSICDDQETVINALQDLGGLMEDCDYPYVGKKQAQCRHKQVLARVTVTDHQVYSGLTDTQLKQILVKEGPLAISVDSTVLDSYTGGILNACSHRNARHAILLVGYGTENAQDYWIIKNSKGQLWGEHGYARVAQVLQCLCVDCQVLTVTVERT